MAFYQTLRNENSYPRGREKPGQAGWVADRLLRLRALLNGQIVSKRRPNSLIVGSWNIRHFDGGRKRLPESYHYIAEIIDHFDICAIQEVKDIEAMEKLMRLLGRNWDYFINDSSGGGRGNHERMAFVYNRNRVFFRNLIGELVFEKGTLPGDEQIGRTPFFASFQAGWFKFTLCSAHIVFEETEGRPLREDEINAIATILKQRATTADEVHIMLGDMNIETLSDAGMAALKRNGFLIPELGATSLVGGKYYDQITFTGPAKETRLLNKGVIRWQEAVFTDSEAAAYETIAAATREAPDTGQPYSDWARTYPGWRTHEMSDHLPVWIEIEIDYSNEYLQTVSELQPGQVDE
ncbi:endonuclease/exonuclease/phosphatase family protein [Rhizobium herbae]|uniref:Endonuclease/exonuclease/phosphatase family metal-dependent hydrolase n=1 Tax=Rhizobium herbae TaxID=508661 RepID=A0ABS4EGC3_9HYPH|nr:endonuclease/exonuclease/phosphatase family protein [Rhizobium herbae]MBP1856997.1 endonuclease/exonuclease/phosphatase family metal-dependent hydrolase [Rhizobium herbae]